MKATQMDVLFAVAEPTRLKMIAAMAAGPLNVTQVANAVGINIVNASHHLGVMRNAGLVKDTKDGRNVIYAMNPDVFVPGDDDSKLGTVVAGNVEVTIRPEAKAKKKVA